MKASHRSPHSIGNKFNAPDSKMDINNISHYFADREWLAIRRSQMDVADNCIFPARERKSMRHYLMAIIMVAATLVKLPVR